MAALVSEGGLFQHEPLDNDQPSVRLIRLKPLLSTGGLIECEMFHTTISAKYRCLSYRWGEESAHIPIVMNGARFYIRKQLHEFLKLQRDRIGTSWSPDDHFWIDALCIDQTNILERGRQVARMGQIFSKASEVLIWLGSTPKLSLWCETQERLKQLVSRMTLGDAEEISQLFNERGTISPLLAYTWAAGQKITAPIYSGLGGGRIDFSKQKLIEEEITGNKYWSRAWITQEVCLAQRAVLVLETEKQNLPLRKLFDVMQRSSLRAEGRAFWQLGRLISESEVFFCSKGSSRGKYLSETFMPLLFRFRDKDCAIPRDRIFSILPLYRWGHLIKVDYSTTDDRLVVDILNSLREPATVCSVASFVHSLRPRSGRLSSGYIEIDIILTALYWGPLQVFRTHIPSSPNSCKEVPQAPPIYARSLHRVGDDHEKSRNQLACQKPQLGPSGLDCQFWLLMRQYCLRQITLVGLPANCSWEDARIPGEQIQWSNVNVRHSAKDHPKALPGPGSSKQWRWYTEGVTLPEQNGTSNIWTFRVSLATVWAYMEEIEWKEPQMCSHLCRDVRLGCSD